MEHRDIPASQNHGIVRWYYTTTVDRDAATVTAADVGKLAQVGVGETAAFYALVGVSPTIYKQLGSAPAVPYITGFEFTAGQLTITLSDTTTLSVLGVAEASAVAAITAALGAVDGIATLDSSGQLVQPVPVANLVGVIGPANLPSYVDDVLEYADFASLPGTGETGKIYITLDNSNSYRWTGSVYLKIADDDVLFYADLAAFPVSGAAGILYVALDTKKVYVWTGAAYEEASAGLSAIADQTLLGNISGGAAVPTALNKSQVQTLLDIGWVLQTRTTAAPNATIPAHAHTATGAETNIDYVIRPKGTGALLAQVPDNTSTGGNKRGTRAVDLQRSRSAATQVASGQDSIIGAGTNNTASGTRGTVPNGNSCTASGADSLAGGDTCVTSGQYGFSWGFSHSNAGFAGTAVGYDHTIGSSGVGASALGLSHDLNGRGSSVLGVGGKDFGMSGLHIITGENSTSDVGRRQVVKVVLHKATTDATTGALTQGGGAVSNTNTFKYPIASQTYYIKGRVTARKSAATQQVKVWDVVAVLGDVGAGMALLVDTITEVYESAGATAWALAANLDTGNGRFYYNVTGEAGVSIDWVGDLNIHFGASGV